MPHTLISFWAKTSHNFDKFPNAFHPLICHMIDVAVVAKKIWTDVLPTATKKRINKAFGLEDSEKYIAFIAGLHDLGKCSPPFTLRGLNENGKQTANLLSLYKNQQYWMDAVDPSVKVPHGYVTAVELPKILIDDFNLNEGVAKQISTLIGGHHGIFPSSQQLNNLNIESRIGKPVWVEARRVLADELAKLLEVKPIQQNPNTKFDNGTIMILAGLVSVADWIGSNTEFFESAVEDFAVENFELKQGSLENYFAHAKKQAEIALKKLGWLNWPEQTYEKEFFDLFPKLKDYIPRDLQSQAINIAEELKAPGTIVVEAPMGEGKTEAAMYLADAWNAKLEQRGIYFALPTQATSNQMFGRVEEFLKGRFDHGIVQLQLSHGHSSLSSEFDALKKCFGEIQGVYEECSGDNCVPHVVAAEWFTYRKRGLLAPFGVGTIDQALMAVLQTKHVFVRLFGLAHKTIIIDEVHAYDAYMSTLLERLLEWLAALGSPVVLLSATLPRNRRDALVRAYQRGLGIDESKTIGADSYPRISYATDSIIKVWKLETSEQNSKTLYLEKVDENFIEKLKAKLEKDGGCVAIICNTVGRAQEFYKQLSQDSFFADKIDLLHSRFRFCDREIREKRVLARFGKPDKNGESLERPECAVLIATQIIEQSLDLDFDLMISDLAPIDLLLQRAGRLHRHNRKGKRPKEFDEKANLWIVQSEMKDNLPYFGVHKYVYEEHILLRTWLELKKITQIVIPNEIEKLIEAVYDKSQEYFDELYQNKWNETKAEMDKKLRLKRAKAKTCRITDADDDDLFENVSLQLDEDNPEKHKTLQALTRDDEMPTVSVIVLSQKDLKSINLEAKPNKHLIKFLLKREAKISKYGVTDLLINSVDYKQKSWRESALLHHHRLLILDQDNKVEIGKFTLKLHKDLGILID